MITMSTRRHLRKFTRLVLHGDDEHRAWLLEAVQAYIDEKPMPPPRGKGVTVPASSPGSSSPSPPSSSTSS
jgi:hypothetical protein